MVTDQYGFFAWFSSALESLRIGSARGGLLRERGIGSLVRQLIVLVRAERCANFSNLTRIWNGILASWKSGHDNLETPVTGSFLGAMVNGKSTILTK